MAEIKVYGSPWCPDCKLSKKFLAEHRIPMDWIDIDTDPDGLRVVEEIQSGGHSIPTIVFPDGSHLIEPSDDVLARKLGLTLEASRQFYELIIIGGDMGMAGAPILAARAALRSGIGMVRLMVCRDNLPIVQTAVPEAPAHACPENADDVQIAITSWPDAAAIGPGPGATPASRALAGP